jgi:urease accessory protein
MSPAFLAGTRLLQMASQAFPIGGYSHSQGLESAVDGGLVGDEAAVQCWILDVLRFSMSSYELPVLRRMTAAWQSHDERVLMLLNDEFLASRESAELRRATVQMGFSLRELLKALPDLPETLQTTAARIVEPSLPCLWSGLATAWSIEPRDSMVAYAWTWAENQVLVAMKSVPIGQAAGQRILLHVGAQIARAAAGWLSIAEETHSNFAPGLAILSSRHETQYSRLFRS